MANPPRVGLVTVTYNSAEVIDEFLRCVVALDYPDFLLFVVDNDSRDDTLERVARRADARIRVLATGENLGIAEGNNVGVRAARKAGCEYVLLLNNDTEFSPGLVRGLVEGAKAAGALMATPKILFFDPPGRIWYGGGEFVAWKGHQARHLRIGKPDRGTDEAPRIVSYAPACSLLVAMEVFDRIGEMDRRIFVYHDDVDFCFRAMKAGIKILYLPGVVLLHKEGSLTGGATSPFSIRMGTRNRVYFLRKHLGVRATPYLGAYLLLILGRILRGPRPVRLGLRLRSFFEGMRMPVTPS